MRLNTIDFKMIKYFFQILIFPIFLFSCASDKEEVSQDLNIQDEIINDEVFVNYIGTLNELFSFISVNDGEELNEAYNSVKNILTKRHCSDQASEFENNMSEILHNILCEHNSLLDDLLFKYSNTQILFSAIKNNVKPITISGLASRNDCMELWHDVYEACMKYLADDPDTNCGDDAWQALFDCQR